MQKKSSVTRERERERERELIRVDNTELIRVDNTDDTVALEIRIIAAVELHFAIRKLKFDFHHILGYVAPSV